MSIQVANNSLVGAVVGTKSVIKFGQAIPPPTISQQMQPTTSHAYRLVVQNESGCGLTGTFPVSGKQVTIRAGDGRVVRIPPGDTELDCIVNYVLTGNAPVSQLLADLYLPGEEIDGIGSLGNSPISGATSLTTKIPINTTGGNQVAIEIGPDSNSLSDWEFICSPSGDLFLWDNKNSRVVWDAMFANGQMSFPTVVDITPDANNLTILATAIANGNVGVKWLPNAGHATAGAYAWYKSDNNYSLGIFDYGVNGHTSGNIWAVDENGAITIVGRQNTVGKYGVSTVVASVKQLAVSSSAAVAVINFTTPNDGINHRYRVGSNFWVGAGNTNNGNINLQVSWTDPVSAGLLIESFWAQGANPQVFLGGGVGNVPKGANNTVCIAMEMEVSPNTTLQLAYQNGAAGTIADKVSGCIEVLA